jgi:hypothetical protein
MQTPWQAQQQLPRRPPAAARELSRRCARLWRCTRAAHRTLVPRGHATRPHLVLHSRLNLSANAGTRQPRQPQLQPQQPATRQTPVLQACAVPPPTLRLLQTQQQQQQRQRQQQEVAGQRVQGRPASRAALASAARASPRQPSSASTSRQTGTGVWGWLPGVVVVCDLWCKLLCFARHHQVQCEAASGEEARRRRGRV